MRECASPSSTPVNFTTGGGAQQGAGSLAFTGSKILEGEEVYILKECPPAQSIGKTVMDKGYTFIWDPRGQVPYLIPPSIVPKCRLRVPRNHRICASRVVEYVPQYDEHVQPTQFVPPERLQPLGAVDATPAETPSVAADDVSEPVESVEDASPRSSAIASETADAFAGGIPPHPDDDKTPIELAYEGDDIGIADDPEALKDAAFSEPHILTHYPKNPMCPICQISKSTSKRVSHKPDVKDAKQRFRSGALLRL